MIAGPRRRFWQAARVRREADGYHVYLDDRPLRTPAGDPLVLPTEAFAAALAAEWDALDAEILPERLPLTRAANSAIDRVAARRSVVIDAVADYGSADLLCYRAAEPAALVDRQAAAWDPWLLWSARALGAPLVAVTGVMHQPQPRASLAALRAAVAHHDAFGLTALHELASLSGSLVLSLAVSRRAVAAPEAWRTSSLDEAWQAEQWGLDSDAEAASGRRRDDFLQAAAMLALLQPSQP